MFFEAMEHRRQFSVTVVSGITITTNAGGVEGAVVVDGNDKKNNIQVEVLHNQVVVLPDGSHTYADSLLIKSGNKKLQTVHGATSLVINGKGGNDTLGVKGGSFSNGAVVGMDGGAGADKIDARNYGGPVNIDGGADNDVITGTVGNDTLTGGLGTDVINGFGGVDVITQ